MTKKQAKILRKQIADYVLAYEADSWKGGGDPAEYQDIRNRLLLSKDVLEKTIDDLTDGQVNSAPPQAARSKITDPVNRDDFKRWLQRILHSQHTDRVRTDQVVIMLLALVDQIYLDGPVNLVNPVNMERPDGDKD